MLFGEIQNLFLDSALIQDGSALAQFNQTGVDVGHGLVVGQLDLLAGAHVLDGGHTGVDLLLAQEDGEGNADLVGIVHLLLELLLLGVDLECSNHGRFVEWSRRVFGNERRRY